MEEKYNHGEPTRLLETKIAPNGSQYGQSCTIPKSVGVISELRKQAQLPGIIIFVHGVNSEGEWYDNAELFLCDGLNERLNLKGSSFELKSNKYKNDGTFPSGFTKKNDGRSPIIRFYWGYRPEDDRPDEQRQPECPGCGYRRKPFAY